MILDANNNGVGEYAIPSLTSYSPCPILTVEDLNTYSAKFLHDGAYVLPGYNVRVYLPDGNGGIYDAVAYKGDSQVLNKTSFHEKSFLIIMSPINGAFKQMVVVMCEDGQRRTPGTKELFELMLMEPLPKNVFKSMREGGVSADIPKLDYMDWPFFSAPEFQLR